MVRVGSVRVISQTNVELGFREVRSLWQSGEVFEAKWSALCPKVVRTSAAEMDEKVARQKAALEKSRNRVDDADIIIEV